MSPVPTNRSQHDRARQAPIATSFFSPSVSNGNMCRTYGALHRAKSQPGLPPWASLCRAYGAFGTNRAVLCAFLFCRNFRSMAHAHFVHPPFRISTDIRLLHSATARIHGSSASRASTSAVARNTPSPGRNSWVRIARLCRSAVGASHSSRHALRRGLCTQNRAFASASPSYRSACAAPSWLPCARARRRGEFFCAAHHDALLGAILGLNNIARLPKCPPVGPPRPHIRPCQKTKRIRNRIATSATTRSARTRRTRSSKRNRSKLASPAAINAALTLAFGDATTIAASSSSSSHASAAKSSRGAASPSAKDAKSAPSARPAKAAPIARSSPSSSAPPSNNPPPANNHQTRQ